MQYASQIKQYKKYKRKNYRPSKNRGIIEASIIDNDFWSELKTCCGIVYENKMIGAVLLIDSKFNAYCVHHNYTKTSNMNEIDHKNKISLSKQNENITNVVTSALYNKNGLSKQLQQSNNNKQNCLNFTHNSIEHLAGTKNLQQSNLQDNQSSVLPLTNNKNDIDILPAYLQSISNNNKLKKLESTVQSNEKSESTRSYNYLHKIKSDSSKIVKQSINKFAPAKLKSNDLNLVKNFVRICTEKSTKNLHFIPKSAVVGGENEVLGNKFNENSSDSGYEEILQEPNQVCCCKKKCLFVNFQKIIYFFVFF